MHTSNNELYDLIQMAKDEIGDDAIQIIADHLNIDVDNRGRACCPFHNEDTPSFIWNPQAKYFRCFGCGRVYSILDYFVDIKGSYKEALNALFRKAHIESDMYGFKPFDDDRKDWFHDYKYPHSEQEPTAENAIKYLNLRGISEKTIKYAGIKEDKNGNIAFEYRDLDDKLLAVKYRPSRKVHKDESKMWYQKNASTVPIIWNVKKLDFTKPLLLQEGEIDVLSVIESGWNNTGSIPNGANSTSWLEFNYDYLQNFSQIILWFDNDKAGEEGLQKVIPRLGEYRCKLVKPTTEDEQMVEDYYAQYGVEGIRKTDANNILLACGKERVIELIQRAEEIPVKNLKYLMDCEVTNVNEMERTTTGLKGLDDILYGNLFPCFTIYSGVAGCVDCDTEFFNGYQWKKIKDYVEGDKILQYNRFGEATLVKPTVYHKYFADKLWHFKTKYGLDQCLSDEHNVYYITSKGYLNNKSFKELKEQHEKSKNGFSGKFITTFDFSNTGINLTDAEIKLMCAVICDGSFYYDNPKAKDFRHRKSNRTCRFHIKKDRKKDKLREIFKECNIKYREIESANVGYTDFYVSAPRHEKEFTSYWYDCTQHQLQIICDNILFWDGCESNNRKKFTTTNKNTADFVQFAFSACGYRSRIITKDRVGQKYLTNGKEYTRKSIEYEISITSRILVGMSNVNKTEIKPYKTKDGFKYCFTVPSHMWVARRNGCIFITGNSGKSSIANITTILSNIEEGHKVCVFSGELDEGQLASWIMSPLGGANHTIVWDNNGGKKGYSIEKNAEKAIREYYHDNIIVYSTEENLETSGQDLLNSMEIAYKKYGCDVFLVDNLMCLTFNNIEGESKWDSQKKFIIKLMNFTKQYGVNVNLVLHPKKPANGQTDVNIYDLHGASEIGNLCHRMLWVKKLKDDEDGFSTEISVIKDRPSQSAGQSCKLMYDTHTRRFYSTNEEFYHKYSWEQSYHADYPDYIKKNLMCNREDVMKEVPKISDVAIECDQY